MTAPHLGRESDMLTIVQRHCVPNPAGSMSGLPKDVGNGRLRQIIPPCGLERYRRRRDSGGFMLQYHRRNTQRRAQRLAVCQPSQRHCHPSRALRRTRSWKLHRRRTLGRRQSRWQASVYCSLARRRLRLCRYHELVRITRDDERYGLAVEFRGALACRLSLVSHGPSSSDRESVANLAFQGGLTTSTSLCNTSSDMDYRTRPSAWAM